MTALTFIDGNGTPRQFEFTEEVSNLFRFLIDTQEKLEVDIAATNVLTAPGLSTVIGLGNVKTINYRLALTTVGTSISFNFKVSSNGGSTYDDFFDSDIVWTSNQVEYFTLDNTITGYTNIQVELKTIIGGTPNLNIQSTVIR